MDKGQKAPKDTIFRDRQENLPFYGINDLNELSQEITKYALVEFDASVVILYELSHMNDLLEAPATHSGELFFPKLIDKKSTSKIKFFQKFSFQKETFYATNAALDWTHGGYITSKDKSKNDNFVRREEIRSAVGVPLIYDDELVGLLFINFRNSKDFSTDERARIDLFARSAAFSIRSKRILSKVENNANVNLLEVFGNALKEKTPVTKDMVFKMIYNCVKDNFNFDIFYLAFFRKIDNAIEFAKVEDKSLDVNHYMPRSAGNGLTEYVVNTRKYLYLPEGDQGSLEAFGVQYLELGEKSKSWLGVPLIMKGEVLGILCVQDHKKTKAFSSKSIETFRTIADQSALILQVFRDFLTLRVLNLEIENTNKLINQITEINVEYSQFYSYGKSRKHEKFIQIRNKAIKVVLDSIVKRLDAEGGKVYYNIPEKSVIEHIFSIGLDHRIYKLGKQLKYGEGVAGNVILENKPIIQQSYDEYPDHLEEFSKLFGSVICVPINNGKIDFGVLSIFDKNQKGQFSKESIPVLKKYSNILAWVLQHWEREYLSMTEFNENAGMLTSDASNISLILDDCIKSLNSALEHLDAQEHIESDNYVIKLKLLIPKLFEYRYLGDGYAVIVNSIGIALQNTDDKLLSKDQLEFFKDTLFALEENIEIPFEDAMLITEEFKKHDLDNKIVGLTNLIPD